MDAGRSAEIGINPPPTPTPTAAASLQNMMMSILASASSSSTASSPSPSSASASAAAAIPQPPTNPHDPEGECRLLGSFALLVQAALGGLALLSLVYKRWRERPQRPVKIWFFDVSKQVFGSVLVHIANIFISMLTSGGFSITASSAAGATAAANEDDARRDQPYIPNPCSFYLLNLAIDVRSNATTKRRRKEANKSLSDYPRHPNPHPPPPPHNSHRLLHPGRQAARVHPVRQLRPPAKRMVVAQAVRHLLLRPVRHEDLRPRHLCRHALDLQGRRLGAQLDRRQREAADCVCHDDFPADYECRAVLYY